MTAYTATKHAVLAMADGLRRDLADTGVKVSIYCPGVVNTRIWDSRAHRLEQYGGATESFPADVVPKIVEMVARIGQDPDETARMVFDGIANGEFMIITSPIIREFAETRAAEVAAALDTMDRRLADTGA
jgi:short-subunit dehydrogenase